MARSYLSLGDPEERTMRERHEERSRGSGTARGAAAGTRRDVAQVDLWVAMWRTRAGEGWETGKRGQGNLGGRALVGGGETVFVSQVSRAVHGHGDRPSGLT